MSVARSARASRALYVPPAARGSAPVGIVIDEKDVLSANNNSSSAVFKAPPNLQENGKNYELMQDIPHMEVKTCPESCLTYPEVVEIIGVDECGDKCKCSSADTSYQRRTEGTVATLANTTHETTDALEAELPLSQTELSTSTTVTSSSLLDLNRSPPDVAIRRERNGAGSEEYSLLSIHCTGDCDQPHQEVEITNENATMATTKLVPDCNALRGGRRGPRKAWSQYVPPNRRGVSGEKAPIANIGHISKYVDDPPQLVSRSSTADPSREPREPAGYGPELATVAKENNAPLSPGEFQYQRISEEIIQEDNSEPSAVKERLKNAEISDDSSRQVGGTGKPKTESSEAKGVNERNKGSAWTDNSIKSNTVYQVLGVGGPVSMTQSTGKNGLEERQPNPSFVRQQRLRTPQSPYIPPCRRQEVLSQDMESYSHSGQEQDQSPFVDRNAKCGENNGRVDDEREDQGAVAAHEENAGGKPLAGVDVQCRQDSKDADKNTAATPRGTGDPTSINPFKHSGIDVSPCPNDVAEGEHRGSVVHGENSLAKSPTKTPFTPYIPPSRRRMMDAQSRAAKISDSNATGEGEGMGPLWASLPSKTPVRVSQKARPTDGGSSVPARVAGAVSGGMSAYGANISEYSDHMSRDQVEACTALVTNFPAAVPPGQRESMLQSFIALGALIVWSRPDEALATFATPAVARQAVSSKTSRSSALVVQLLSEARDDIRKSLARVELAKPGRPPADASSASRLISGALGIRRPREKRTGSLSTRSGAGGTRVLTSAHTSKKRSNKSEAPAESTDSWDM